MEFCIFLEKFCVVAKTGNKRTSQQLQVDRAQVAAWYCQGRTQAWMGEQLGITQQQISYDLKAIRKEWAANYADFNTTKDRELAKIDELERTYWDAWERSCEAAVTAATKLVTDKRRFQEAQQYGTQPASDRVDITTRKEEQVGDPRFLAGVERCIKMRRDMLGLDEPRRLQIDWREFTVQHIVTGQIDYDGLKQEFGESLANELFEQAGVPRIQSGDASTS